MELRTRSALTELFHQHASGLAGAIRGILGPNADVQEVLQEAFLRAWKSWNRGLPIQDPAAWVFVLTMNLARDLRRKAQRRGENLNLEEVDAVKLLSKVPQPPQKAERQEWVSAAREAIRSLGEAEKEVFLLRTSGGRTFSAISDVLDIPVGTAKTRMRGALKHLRAALSEFAPSNWAESEGFAFGKEPS